MRTPCVHVSVSPVHTFVAIATTGDGLTVFKYEFEVLVLFCFFCFFISLIYCASGNCGFQVFISSIYYNHLAVEHFVRKATATFFYFYFFALQLHSKLYLWPLLYMSPHVWCETLFNLRPFVCTEWKVHCMLFSSAFINFLIWISTASFFSLSLLINELYTIYNILVMA